MRGERWDYNIGRDEDLREGERRGWNEAIEAAANLFSPNDWEGWIPEASDEIAQRIAAAIRKLKKP